MKHWKIFFFGNSQLNAAAAIPEDQNKPYYYVCRYIISKVHNDFKSKTFKNRFQTIPCNKPIFGNCTRIIFCFEHFRLQ